TGSAFAMSATGRASSTGAALTAPGASAAATSAAVAPATSSVIRPGGASDAPALATDGAEGGMSEREVASRVLTPSCAAGADATCVEEVGGVEVGPPAASPEGAVSARAGPAHRHSITRARSEEHTSELQS